MPRPVYPNDAPAQGSAGTQLPAPVRTLIDLLVRDLHFKLQASRPRTSAALKVVADAVAMRYLTLFGSRERDTFAALAWVEWRQQYGQDDPALLVLVRNNGFLPAGADAGLSALILIRQQMFRMLMTMIQGNSDLMARVVRVIAQ